VYLSGISGFISIGALMQNVLDWAARGTRPSIANRITYRFRKATLRGLVLKRKSFAFGKAGSISKLICQSPGYIINTKNLHNVQVICSYAIVMQLRDLHGKTKAHHGPFFRPLSSSNFTRQDSMVDEMLHGPSPTDIFDMKALEQVCVRIKLLA